MAWHKDKKQPAINNNCCDKRYCSNNNNKIIIAEKWYIHKPEKVLESEDCKILWDFPVQTEKSLEYNQPDITVIDKKSKKCLLIDPEFPSDTCTERKEEEKCTNYSVLK